MASGSPFAQLAIGRQRSDSKVRHECRKLGEMSGMGQEDDHC
jgi:hypothetical protein